MFFADGNLLYSRHKIYDVFFSQILLLMANRFILDQHFLKTTFFSSQKLYVNIYLLLLQYLFCIKQANKIFHIFSSHGLLPSDLVAQSVERRRSNPKVVGSIPTLVRVFLCPCVGPFPSVGLMLTWFIWDRNLALHITLYSVNSANKICALLSSYF